MEHSKSFFWNHAMKWGLYLSLALMAESLIFYMVGKTGSPVESWIMYLLILTGIVVATNDFKNKSGDNQPFSYGNTLGYGVSVVLFASIVMAVYTFILYQFVAPELLEKLLLDLEEAYLNAGLADDMVEQQVKMLKTFMTPGILAFSQIFSLVFIGFVIALISSLFLKKNNQDGFNSAMRELEEDE